MSKTTGGNLSNDIRAKHMVAMHHRFEVRVSVAVGVAKHAIAIRHPEFTGLSGCNLLVDKVLQGNGGVRLRRPAWRFPRSLAETRGAKRLSSWERGSLTSQPNRFHYSRAIRFACQCPVRSSPPPSLAFLRAGSSTRAATRPISRHTSAP